MEEEREWTIIFGDAAVVVGISLFSMMNEGKFSMDCFQNQAVYLNGIINHNLCYGGDFLTNSDDFGGHV